MLDGDAKGVSSKLDTFTSIGGGGGEVKSTEEEESSLPATSAAEGLGRGREDEGEEAGIACSKPAMPASLRRTQRRQVLRKRHSVT
jgi:hypothetical protein